VMRSLMVTFAASATITVEASTQAIVMVMSRASLLH
jgi:hypothetical protein